MWAGNQTYEINKDNRFSTIILIDEPKQCANRFVFSQVLKAMIIKVVGNDIFQPPFFVFNKGVSIMKNSGFFVMAFILLLFTSPSYAGFIYSKPELMGQVIDAETWEPIAGAVVSVYYENGLYIDFTGRGTVCIHTYETTTDESGRFHIPAYTTLIWPTRYDNGMGVIIYKPGYTNYPTQSEVGLKGVLQFFSQKNFGKEGKTRYFTTDKWTTYRHGIVELRKLVKWMDRMRAIPSPSRCDIDDLPLLREITIKEMDALGL